MNSDWSVITRRSFMGGIAATGAALAFAGCKGDPSGAKNDDNPIFQHPEENTKRFFGDNPMRFHPLLWNKNASVEQYGGLPADKSTFERTKVCIVGGGLSGLSAGYLCRDLKPLILEGAVRLGGNAKAHNWDGLIYGLGSAYITNAPGEDGHMKMLADLGLNGRFDDPTHDQVAINNVVYPDFWLGGSDTSRAADFRT
ncbi:MAG: NAD(P)-binding protein, partial [Clostridia bacterium]|nr:NAD(P)-binding protein [Deltaproteobacteria bacterium]